MMGQLVIKGKPEDLPGCIFNNNGRYWWRVKLPGEGKYLARPLKPAGAKFATADPAVAIEVAKEIYERAIFKFTVAEKNPQMLAWDGSLSCLIKNFLVHAEQRYVKADGTPTGEAGNIRSALNHLICHCPKLQAADFGPFKLEEVRQKMIEAQLARGVINQRVNIIRRMFRWAARKQFIPSSVWHGLLAVEGLRKGMPGVKEPEAIRPVPERTVRITLSHLTPIVADMVQIQLLTGMRSGELVIMRPCDIMRKNAIWVYNPSSHKNEHHDYKRVVALGPKAQKILKKYLSRPADSFCFSPAEADKQRRKVIHDRRRTPKGRGNEPGTNVSDLPKKKPGKAYTSKTYARSISYACKAAGIVPWHPHQLRHAAATRLRQAFKKKGLDVARAVLGHRSLGMADHYAELDLSLAIEAARKTG